MHLPAKGNESTVPKTAGLRPEQPIRVERTPKKQRQLLVDDVRGDTRARRFRTSGPPTAKPERNKNKTRTAHRRDGQRDARRKIIFPAKSLFIRNARDCGTLARWMRGRGKNDDDLNTQVL